MVKPSAQPGNEDGKQKSSIRAAVCMPRQEYDRLAKIKWLAEALQQTECDLFLLPQEYFGGHYIMDKDHHVELKWLDEKIGDLARLNQKSVGVGACVTDGGGATEDYIYYDAKGERMGAHRKFALPAYDDVRARGAGDLWPETSYSRRTTPVELPDLGLKIGTVFCWEVFSQTVFGAYSFAGCNLIVHPIKFAPRGWLKLKKESGHMRIVGFDQNAKSSIWIDKLKMASRHECLCPIAVSCNSWDLGEKFKALVGWVDEMTGTTALEDVPSVGKDSCVKVFEMNPGLYLALDSMFSAGAFKEKAGSLDDYHRLGEWTMHAKMRRLEAHLIGGTTRLDCVLKSAAMGRQKKSTAERAGKL